MGPPLTLRFEDHNYKTTDWSIGGFRISDFHRPVHPGDRLDGGVVTWGGLKQEAFEATVVRLSYEGDVCCRFLTLPLAMVTKATYYSESDVNGETRID